ncbi:MAG TPA: D-alanyl-D-alanine carboxypeptidase family protein [Gaiellaceae bacterium]|nr:D-alanyl-D-alanine carboxypeptidase family protein [Gaiellaceae bacterium]
MKRALILLALAALICASAARATPVPPIDAKAYLVIDERTGQVLASSHADEELPIASLTKLMTVLLTLEHHKLTDVVTVDKRAAEVGESSIELAPGQKITVHDLLEGALIQSANNAADALALSMAKNYGAFSTLMNAKAQELGLTHTRFVRPDGLDAPGEYSSAADITRLAQLAMRNAFVRATVQKETATIADGQELHTWDDLLGLFPGVFGVKTGHTDNAGWCQVAAVRGNGVSVYVTVLGGPTRTVRNQDLASLAAWGLAQFRGVTAVQLGRTYATVKLPYGRKPLPLVARTPLNVVVRLGHPLTQTVIAPRSASLPVKKGAVLGRVEIRDGGTLIGTRDLIASRSVSRPGVLGRLGFYSRRTVYHLAHLL